MKNLRIFSSGIAMLLLLLPFRGSAQKPSADKVVITGVVSDSSGPIPGANVVVEGTHRKTQTDIDGRYTLAAFRGETLVFSYVGFNDHRVIVRSKRVINVRMAEAVQLQEVVVMSATGIRRNRDAVTSSRQTPRSDAKGVSTSVARDHEPYWVANTESYANVEENVFQDPQRNALSTFAIDVDNASYTNIRRFINQGKPVPRDAVRIEEMVNFFKYDYPQPTGPHPFSINTDLSECPWNPGHKLLRIGLQGKTLPTESLPASNLVFLIDVSGSMTDENKLPLLKRAMNVLLRELRPRDKVSIVVYAGSAGLVLPPTPGNSPEIAQALENLYAGGSTAGGAGIELAYTIASENFIKNGNNRVILATDGDFNVGSTSAESMETLITEKRNSGVFLTVLGFGMGNLKDDRLELLANKGNGNYAYIDNMQEANRFLGREFKGNMFAIAKDVKVQIEFNPRHVAAYRLIGYENRLLRDHDFTDDAIDAGEIGSGHSVTALYEIIPHGIASEYVPKNTELKYSVLSPKSLSAEQELATVKFRYKRPDGEKSVELVQPIANVQGSLAGMRDDFRMAAAVAWFGLKLRDSKYAGSKSLEGIKELAGSALVKDPDGYRSEFIRLLATSQ